MTEDIFLMVFDQSFRQCNPHPTGIATEIERPSDSDRPAMSFAKDAMKVAVQTR